MQHYGTPRKVNRAYFVREGTVNEALVLGSIFFFSIQSLDEVRLVLSSSSLNLCQTNCALRFIETLSSQNYVLRMLTTHTLHQADFHMSIYV